MLSTAFILAAGRGDRLRPITNFIPKPLVQVAGKTLLQRHLEHCAASNFQRVIVNHAHLGEQIVEHCRKVQAEQNLDFELIFSAEPDGGLETAGGIIHALDLIKEKSFALINADIYCDYDLTKLHCVDLESEQTLAHLILVPTPEYKSTQDFYLSESGEKQSIKNQAGDSDTGYTFAGISVILPKLLANLEPGKSRLAPLLRSAVDKNLITAEVHHGQWHDVGTQERLKSLRKTLNQQF